MQPEPKDTTIRLPITFDYKGGRNETKKNKWILAGVSVVLCLVIIIGIFINNNLSIIVRLLYSVGVLYAFLLFLRFFVFKEQYYSDIYESLKEVNFLVPVTCIWKIFDVDYTYPYVAYFKNGMKGIFVKMEKDAVTGKGENACFNHYEAISDALNKAHSKNMNIRHIDYMDNVGNDSRLKDLYEGLKDVENPDMEEMLIDIYDNLQDEMSLDYASFDIYLFLSRDKIENFMYNVQTVCNSMLGGNFITYRVLNRADLRTVCMALFNLHDFSVVSSCEEVLHGESHRGIVPIRIIHEDGTQEKLNKTQEEKRVELEERVRKQKEQKAEMRNKKRNKRKKEVANQDLQDSSNDNIDLFS